MTATQRSPISFPLQAPAEQITQAEIALVISLQNRKRALEQQVAEAERSIMTRLEAGVPVEPGHHVAALKESWRKSIGWKAVCSKLASSLGLDGQTYVQRVLDTAKAIRSVTLFVS